MSQAIVLLLLMSTAVASLVRPWIGVVAAYLFVVLGPQSIWWWAFQGIRPVMWIVLPTLIGLSIAIFRGQIDFSIVRNKRVFYVLILWLAYTLSYYLGPYVDVGGIYRFTDPAWAASTINKIMLLFFVACLCIDSVKKLQALVAVMIASGIYLIYWANHAYLTGQIVGRMYGPSSISGGGMYVDNNNFAMLYVVVLPFFWYCGFLLKNKYYRWALWLLIPLGWHAIFLTGSRGGLLGIGATMMIMVWRSRNKAMAALLVPAFVFAYVFQAGDVMKDRAATISDYETERSAASRLESWRVARSMIADHPLTGVGLASFGPAYPKYSDAKVREAHNTFFQIAGESGLVAGMMYILIVVSSLLVAWRTGKRLRESVHEGDANTIYCINEAVLVGFSGLVVCSMFLSLQLFEIFYCLCVMINAIAYLMAKGKLKSPIENSDDATDVATISNVDESGNPNQATRITRG